MRVLITIIWFLVVVGVDIFAFFILEDALVGAIIEFALALITLCVPYLRAKGSYTRWWGWLAFLSGISLLGYHFELF